MSALLSSLRGEIVTAAELLGEPEPGTTLDEQKAASDALEAKLEAVRRRRGGR